MACSYSPAYTAIPCTDTGTHSDRLPLPFPLPNGCPAVLTEFMEDPECLTFRRELSMMNETRWIMSTLLLMTSRGGEET